MSANMDWSGKAAVVTGAARGQGAEEVRLLLDRGAVVYAIDRVERAKISADLLGHPQSAGLMPVTMDVGDPVGWDKLATTVRTGREELVALVNNAGVAFRRGVVETIPEEWDAVLRTNLTGAFLGIRSMAPLMPAGSSIVNIGSVAGHTGYFAAAYCVSKWGIRGLTRTAALELGRAGIRVNCVSPGLIETPMTGQGSVFAKVMQNYVPLARPGHPHDVAQTVMFLLEPGSSYITGADIVVDGGMEGAGLFAHALTEIGDPETSSTRLAG